GGGWAGTVGPRSVAAPPEPRTVRSRRTACTRLPPIAHGRRPAQPVATPGRFQPRLRNRLRRWTGRRSSQHLPGAAAGAPPVATEERQGEAQGAEAGGGRRAPRTAGHPSPV